MILMEYNSDTLATAPLRRKTVAPLTLLPSFAGNRLTPNSLPSNSPLPSPPADECPPNNLKPLTDEELVKFCKLDLSKNLNCFEELVSRYRNYIFNYALKRIGDASDAEEVVQDSFVRVYNNIKKFEGRSSFKNWLFKIVSNLCCNKIKSLATRRTNGSDYDQELSVQFNADLTDPGTGDLAHKMQEAMKSLDEKKLTIIKLRFISGLQIEEIAEILDLKLSATKMRLYRALEEVKEGYLRASRQELVS